MLALALIWVEGPARMGLGNYRTLGVCDGGARGLKG